eukprot:12881934-Prorocentrum_lima.AAC.1
MDYFVCWDEWGSTFLAGLTVPVDCFCVPTANLTTALLVPEASLGRLVSRSGKCEAPESHMAKRITC